MNARMFRIGGTSHRLLVHDRLCDCSISRTPHFELVSLASAPVAREVLPALRKLAATWRIGCYMSTNDDVSGYAARNDIGLTGASNWRLFYGHDVKCPTALGTVLVRRERQVAKIHISTAGRLTCGFTGPVAQTLLLLSMAGLDGLTTGWEYARLIEEEVRFETAEAETTARMRTAG